MMGSVALAAPIAQNFTNIQPFITDTYDNGTSTNEWLHVFTKTLCLSGDCRSVWPTSGGGSSSDFTTTTNYNATANATGTPLWFQAGFQASTTNNFIGGLTVDAGGTNASAVAISGHASNAGTSLLLTDTTTAGNTLGDLINPSGTGNANLATVPLAATIQTGSGTTGGLIFFNKANAPIIFGTGGNAFTNERMNILGNGNVGVGSTTAGSLFAIGTTNGINFSTATSTFSSTGGINLTSGCFAIAGTCLTGGTTGNTFGYPFTPATNFGVAASATTTAIWAQNALFASSTTSFPTLAVSQAGTGPAAIFTGGNVAIGTTSPGTANNLAIGGAIGGGAWARFCRDDSSFFCTYLTSNNGAFNFQNTGTSFFSWSNGGTYNANTGNITGTNTQAMVLRGNTLIVGTSTNNSISGGHLNIWGANGFNNYLSVTNADTGTGTFGDVFQITSAGNVGIGSTTPGSLFSIGSQGTGTNFFNNSTTTKSGVGGENIASGCFAVAGVCLTQNTGTVTSIATTYPVTGGPFTTSGTIGLAFGTTTSNTWAGTQTFTNTPTFSFLGAGTVNSTAAGTIYNTATSTPTVGGPITYSGTFGSFIGGVSGAFNCVVATGSVSGCLSSTDWTTFNNKQPAGNYITALTGDGTASGPGSVAFTLATVNSNIGTFNNVTVNGKGLVTAASNVVYDTFGWPFTPVSYGVSTSTTLGLLNGFLSTASSTVNANFFLPQLATSAGSFLAVNPFGQVIATTTPTGTNYWTLTGNNISNNNNSGNGFVGIGSTTPWGQLSVNSNGAVGPEFVVGSSTQTSFVVGNNNNVGIGTTTPLGLFSILGSSINTLVASWWGMTQTTPLGTQTNTFTSSGTYTKPAGAISMSVTVIAGGGGGGSGLNACGGGGGGSSSFGSIVTAVGGGGGEGTFTGSKGLAGNTAGGNGGNAGGTNGQAGGGGGGAQVASTSVLVAQIGATVTVSVGTGGVGCTTLGGAGGTGLFSGAAGNTSVGGGGGGSTGAGSSNTGGTGGNIGGPTVTLGQNGVDGSNGGAPATGAGGNSGSGATPGNNFGAGGNGGSNGNAGSNGTPGEVVIVTTFASSNSIANILSVLNFTASDGTNSYSYPGFGIGTTSPQATFAVQSSSGAPATMISGFIGASKYLWEMLDRFGHLITGGPTPTFVSCGSGPGFIGAANDRNMTVQPGTGVLSSCSLNWNGAYTSNQTVVCSYTQITGTPVALVASTTQSGVVVSGATFTGDRFSLHCEATQ